MRYRKVFREFFRSSLCTGSCTSSDSSAFFSGEQFLSDKLLLHSRQRSSKRRLYRAKIGERERGRKRGRREGLFRCFLRDITSLRRVALHGDAVARRSTGHASEGSRAVEKVDQYQAKRSAPTNLCGDPSNDTSRSLQPNRFREHDVENHDMLLSVCQ